MRLYVGVGKGRRGAGGGGGRGGCALSDGLLAVFHSFQLYDPSFLAGLYKSTELLSLLHQLRCGHQVLCQRFLCDGQGTVSLATLYAYRSC